MRRIGVGLVSGKQKSYNVSDTSLPAGMSEGARAGRHPCRCRIALRFGANTLRRHPCRRAAPGSPVPAPPGPGFPFFSYFLPYNGPSAWQAL